MRYAPYALSKWRIRNDSLSFNNFGKIIDEKKFLLKKLVKFIKMILNFQKVKKFLWIHYIDKKYFI